MKSKKIIGRIITVVVMCALALMIIMSSSPENSVRARILVSGHVMSAFQCNPQKNNLMTRVEKAPVWSIERKYSYLDSTGSYYEQDFQIHPILFLSYATPVPTSG